MLLLLLDSLATNVVVDIDTLTVLFRLVCKGAVGVIMQENVTTVVAVPAATFY